jgi:hypothetical protein
VGPRQSPGHAPRWTGAKTLEAVLKLQAPGTSDAWISINRPCYVPVAMIELIATTMVAAGSALLFAYWFRYTCLLILSAKTVRDYAAQVASANHLSFMQVHSQLAACAAEDLSRLEQVLLHDYSVICALLDGAENQQSGVESWILRLHYGIMRARFDVGRRLSPKIARHALKEMCQIVACLANGVGEAAAVA